VECSFAAGSADSTGQAQVVNESRLRPTKPSPLQPSNTQTHKPKDAKHCVSTYIHLPICNYFSHLFVNALRKSVVLFSTTVFNALNQSKLKIRFLFKAIFQLIKMVLQTHQREKKSLFDEKKNHQSDFCSIVDTFRGFLVTMRAGCGAML
jgi:hypothetical protein